MNTGALHPGHKPSIQDWENCPVCGHFMAIEDPDDYDDFKRKYVCVGGYPVGHSVTVVIHKDPHGTTRQPTPEKVQGEDLAAP